MSEYFEEPIVKILMLKGEKGYKGDKGDSIPSGGTTGQFLKKKSSTDYDYVWSTLETITNAEIDTIIMS